jgi:hypothetical protein
MDFLEPIAFPRLGRTRTVKIQLPELWHCELDGPSYALARWAQALHS